VEKEDHYINRSAWLRAAVLGANDGILSTASIAIGVAAASDFRNPVILATLAGLVAGALSMAAGEYVSVSSQADSEAADLERERRELEEMPEAELKELVDIYLERGLDKETAQKVAVQLTAHNALEAHAREELGITEITQARPLQAAIASSLAFLVGGGMPMLVAYFAPLEKMEYFQYTFALLFLLVLGSISAKAGGASIPRAAMRIAFWGTVAMAVTAAVGYIFKVNVVG